MMAIKRYLLKYCYYLIICYLLAVDDLLAVVIKNFGNSNDNNSTFQKRQAMFWPTCMSLSVINGQVDYLQTNPYILYSSGTTAILTCNFGFTIVGSSNSICMNSIWSPSLGSCELGTQSFNLGKGNAMPTKSTKSSSGSKTQCFAQMLPINGQLHYSQNGVFGAYPSGTTASLSCNPGTSSFGALTSTCENGSWQPHTLGFCSNRGGGSSMSGVTTAYGNSVNPLSAALESSVSALNSDMPQCPNVPRLSNGHVSYSLTQTEKGYPVGTIATLLCNPGFVTSQMTVICGAGGLWSPQLGSCNPLSDPAGGVPTERFSSLMNSPSRYCILGLIPPVGAVISYSQGDTFGPYPSGSTATLTCHSGNAIGPTSATCESGQWNPPFFHGCLMWESGITRTFQDLPEDTTKSSLNPNALVGPAPPTDGLLAIPSSMGMGILGSQTCTLGVPPIAGGTITYSQGGDLGPYPSGTVATFKCHSGQPIGMISSSCHNGVWQPPLIGFCNNPEQKTEHTATDLLVPVSSGLSTSTGGMNMNNGIIGFHQGNDYSLQLPQQCFLGLLPPLNGHITYSSASSQGLPAEFDNATSLGPHPQGTMATLRCNPGFSPNGPAMSMCRNGIFESMLGQCLPSNSVKGMNINNNSTQPRGNDDQYQWSTHAENKPEPEVSKSLENTSNKDIKEMSEELPSCSDLTLNSPDFGSIMYTNNNAIKQATTITAIRKAAMIKHDVGSIATLSCQKGFISIGDTMARCELNGWSVRSLGKCVPTATTSKQDFAAVAESSRQQDFNK